MIRKVLEKCLVVLGIATLMAFNSKANNTDDIENYWISYPSSNITSFGVYHFRKSFTLESVPEKLMADISADNRYQLFVNGTRVCYGPAKGDLKTYKYDVIDIAPFLKEGENILAVLVFNLGEEKPMAFIGYQTAFLFYTADSSWSFLNSDKSWKTIKNEAYDPISYSELQTWKWVKGYYACGPGDEVFASKYPWGWEEIGFDDREWIPAEELIFEKSPPWNLIKRSIPFMDNYREKAFSIRRTTGIESPENFLSGKSSITIPPNTNATILFDFRNFTMGYPELLVSGGNSGKIKMKYAEALYIKPDLKAHRDSVNGLTMHGVFDIFHTDGEKNRLFRPLWKRAFRYLELEITTAAMPLQIHSLENEYSGYPYPEMADFNCSDPMLNEIFSVGLRTLKMCSGETYYDTPYYEQMSYGGDNRPIGAVSFYNSVDDRLFREVMRIYPQSANVETRLFKAAYPSRFKTDMGTWSMAWVQSLLDYYLVRADAEFTRQFINDIEGVLEFHRRRIDEDMGMLGSMSNRNFIDWSIHEGSVPQKRPNVIITHSSMLTLYYLHTLDCATELYHYIGETQKAGKWAEVAGNLRESVYKNCWDEGKGLIADYPDKVQFSQQTNILALLCDLIPVNQEKNFLNKLINYPDFDEAASSYFSYFLFKAMEKTSQEELFLDNLGFWKEFINRGHTTFGETGFASHDRSDCHAWSAHPSYYLLRFVCGIKPGTPGFSTVLIEPHLDGLEFIEASVPLPQGIISINYKVKKKKMHAEIIIPGDLTGILKLDGKEYRLSPGENHYKLDLPDRK
jgi:hypothetical protein